MIIKLTKMVQTNALSFTASEPEYKQSNIYVNSDCILLLEATRDGLTKITLLEGFEFNVKESPSHIMGHINQYQ